MPDHSDTPIPVTTMGTLTVTGPGGRQTTCPLAIVHGPGTTPQTDVAHDGAACGCAPDRTCAECGGPVPAATATELYTQEAGSGPGSPPMAVCRVCIVDRAPRSIPVLR